MIVHPEVQRAAQAQLDDVVGAERLPEYHDEDSLPLITAILWEVIRYVLLLFRNNGCFADSAWGV